MSNFKVVAPFEPMGDQIKAIDELSAGIERGDRGQTLLGVTGSGKTYTIAKTIERVNKPTLVLAHNKILAAQLCSEFKEFFPDNAVEYFVSYYDYYQPEAYIPNTDTYIEKDASTNDEIDKLRHSATAALLERRDVIIVASVSCIYGLGDPDDYKNLMLSLRVGNEYDRRRFGNLPRGFGRKGNKGGIFRRRDRQNFRGGHCNGRGCVTAHIHCRFPGVALRHNGRKDEGGNPWH